jgi:hypothetical protein
MPKKAPPEKATALGDIGIEMIRFRYDNEGVTGGPTYFDLPTQAVYCIGTMSPPFLRTLGAMCREVRITLAPGQACPLCGGG